MQILYAVCHPHSSARDDMLVTALYLQNVCMHTKYATFSQVPNKTTCTYQDCVTSSQTSAMKCPKVSTRVYHEPLQCMTPTQQFIVRRMQLVFC